jgi:hypothetical protein
MYQQQVAAGSPWKSRKSSPHALGNELDAHIVGCIWAATVREKVIDSES